MLNNALTFKADPPETSLLQGWDKEAGFSGLRLLLLCFFSPLHIRDVEARRPRLLFSSSVLLYSLSHQSRSF